MPKGQKNTWKRKYATAEALEEKCNEYFAKCDKDGHLYGEAGLALHLGVKLDTLRKWYDGKDCSDYQEIVQTAYLRIQSQLESDPTYMQKGMVTKAIFMMKQPLFGGLLCSFCVPIGNSGSAGGCFGPLVLGGAGRSPGVAWGCWLLDQGMGGVAEKGTVLLRMGVEYCPTSSPPLHGLGGGGKQAGGLSAIRV